MWTKTVTVPAPYDFAHALERLSLDPLLAVDRERQRITVPLVLDGCFVPVTVEGVGTKDDPRFVVSAPFPERQDEVMERISHLFQWRTPLGPIHEHFRRTDLAPLFAEYEGMPLVLDFDLYFCLIKCLIHQQLHLKVGYRLTERFVKTFGTEVDGVWFYPRPEEVAARSYEDVRALQLSGRKAEYIVDVSRLIADGKLRLDELKQMEDGEVMERLTAVRGIGPWTVQNFLLFGLGRPNVFPPADIGLQRAVEKQFGLPKRPTAKEMAALGERWKPYASYAALYLWRSIE
ncbi:DNA-3-methyladenine glycosylase [Geobacillus stearothermophilus]|uniref:DNA-3-methyladenine glycosylase family protein n=1 Tax=Geobacillus stearothermophilus TaxID=1422 RepID=UPI002E1E4284|nr:DNA-3-methyladenine glycosylase [Geobacillus stearothermophilus]MED3733718.1 DNA-3-methyladenine glycosylase [Geobacillus stearothermophilus]MED3740018.1 DNA-3-methyladenine glycosylase [Geobacillus stearothermophilus]MED3751132.1 DNA-3-methyladenine glycosylase [Geobacillus stearothermophilus]MED3755320.1 DNA-3-methyladenine glycosylase [Geobacillus stearothermophilus]